MKLIAAVSKDWGIGKDGGLLFSIPQDMKFFRETTMGKTVILGRKNLESFPGGRPLKNRRNIILTRSPGFECEGAEICKSAEELLKGGFCGEDSYVIGGGEIYRLLLDSCDECLITKVDETAPADTFMPNLDELPDWYLAEEGAPIEDNGHIIRFCTYKRTKKNL